MTDTTTQTVTVNFKLALGDGIFDASATVPEGQCNLTEILPVLQSLDGSLLSAVTEQLDEAGLSISCKAGCGACCRQMVPLSIFEAEALAVWIATLDPNTRQILAQRFHQALLKLASAGLIDRLTSEDWLADNESATQLTLDYFYQGVPCPFLQDESCSIHPIRPLICREYLVTSDPRHCADPKTLQADPVPLPLNFSRVLNHMGAKLEPGSRGWIPLVFLFAWMENGAHPGTAFSGTGPEVLYEFVRRMEFARKPSRKGPETSTRAAP
ncbi:YkgJ family cysteine cluster protein [Terracidiphilus sp.]|uniref:YkgJ family cysteine cluster protein n=1 Tax=Terracidiphilus sp. TaxID=1964191 RepID=UPI003C16F386